MAKKVSNSDFRTESGRVAQTDDGTGCSSRHAFASTRTAERRNRIRSAVVNKIGGGLLIGAGVATVTLTGARS